MKTQRIQNLVAVLALSGLAMLATTAPAQDAPAAATVPAPQLSSGVSEILRLAQAKVGDDTIITYIKNSGSGYALNADQIIYLRQQGVSAAVINLMLTQTQTATTIAAAPQSPAPAPQPATSTATVAPATVTYVQTVPTSYYYPYYYPNYYGSGWGVYPGVSLSFGWGGRWGGGGGWHGGGHGGWHR